MSVVDSKAYYASRTMQALEALAGGAISAPALAERMEIHGRTARRLLQRLEIDGYAQRDRRGGYTATNRLRELGAWLASAP